MLWRIGEVNSIFMETAGLRQDKNGQIDVIDIWMIKLFINPGMVDKNSSMMFTWWFEIIKLSLGTLCGCLALHPVILSQILTSAAWGFDISGLRKQFSPRPWEVTKEIFFIAKFSLAEFPRNRLVQFFWWAHPQAHSWQGIDTALKFSPISAGWLLLQTQYWGKNNSGLYPPGSPIEEELSQNILVIY